MGIVSRRDKGGQPPFYLIFIPPLLPYSPPQNLEEIKGDSHHFI